MQIFRLLVIGVFSGIMIEWYQIAKNSLRDRLFLYLITALSCIALIKISLMQDARSILSWYGTIIIVYDTMAFLGGKMIGGKKLAISISPAKTWSGLASGIICCIIASYTISEMDNILKSCMKGYNLFVLTLIIAISAQIGDLFESYYKRKYNLKDSGDIIPGHGGLLDRFDSLLFSAPMLYILLSF
ncbi:MAG: CDP-archaeol synthase [Rickettsiaceae bacterium]|nr:CDP-archaeol synthase [Rickettsiaceae bacterium]